MMNEKKRTSAQNWAKIWQNGGVQRETTSLVDVNDKLNKKVHIMEGMYRQVDGELCVWTQSL